MFVFVFVLDGSGFGFVFVFVYRESGRRVFREGRRERRCLFVIQSGFRKVV